MENSAELSSMGILIPVIIGILIIAAIMAGVYFIIYQKHINKVLKDPDHTKKSHIHLPSVGTSMWFIAWVIVTSIIIIQTVEIDRYVKSVNMEVSAVEQQISELQEDHEWYANWIYHFFAEFEESKYTRSPRFSVGNFDPKTNTIELKAEVSPANMSKDDKLTIRIGDVSSALKPDLKNRKFTGTIKTDVFSIEKETPTIDCTFIIESDGVKKIENYDIDNHYNRDDDLEINWANYFPMLHSYTDKIDGQEGFYTYAEGTEDNQTLVLDSNINFVFSPAEKLKGRNFVSGKIVYKADGKAIEEEILDLPKNQDGEFEYTKTVHKEWKAVKGLQAVFVGTDNYGYTYSIPLDTPLPEKEKELYSISDKDGNVLFSSRNYRNFI